MPLGQARARKPRAISGGTEEGRGEGREARQKAGTPRAQKKLKRPWEPETGAMPHSSDSSDSSSFSQSPPPSKQVKRGLFPSSPRLESPSGWAMGGQEEGWHPLLAFSQCSMAGLSRNGCGERDAGLSREPCQEPRPPSWVQERRPGYLGLCQGQLESQDPRARWALQYTLGRQQAGSFGVRVSALARSLSMHLLTMDGDSSGAACLLSTATDSTQDPEKTCRFGSVFFSV